jgi:hypothetical protein
MQVLHDTVSSMLVYQTLTNLQPALYQNIVCHSGFGPVPLRLYMNLTNGMIVGARSIHPLRDVSVGSTSDTRNVNVTGGVIVASLVAAIVDGSLGSALRGRDGV